MSQRSYQRAAPWLAAFLGLMVALYFALPAFFIRGSAELERFVPVPVPLARAFFAPLGFLERQSPRYDRFVTAQLWWSYTLIPGGVIIF